MNETLKILQDTDRTVIIIEGASDERIFGMYNVLNALYRLPGTDEGTSASSTTSTPAGVPARTTLPSLGQVHGLKKPASTASNIPTNEELDHMPLYNPNGRALSVMSSGTYAGMTPMAALARDHEKALVTMFKQVNDVANAEERQDIISCCKSFMANLRDNQSEYDTREKRLACIKTLSEMGGVQACINGWRNLDDFASGASDSEVHIVFKNVINAFHERANRPR